MTSSLLINEPPLQVLPSLAKLIGLNEAIILQQVHYWLGRSKNVRDGKTWVYKTYAEWREEFPFWSEDTIYRTIRKLETVQLLESTDKYNAISTDRTKWYTIDYAHLELIRLPQVAEVEHRKTRKSRTTQLAEVLPETTTKTTNQRKKKEGASAVPPAVSTYREIARRYPNKTLYEDIATAIGDSSESLEKWTAHIKDWISRGWNPTNIKGLLETFEKGIEPRQQNGQGKQRQLTPPTEADYEASARENEQYERVLESALESPVLHTFRSGMAANMLWLEALDTLSGQLEKSTFDTWLKNSRYEGFEDGTLIVRVQSENARQWLTQRLDKKIARALGMWAGEDVTVRYVVAGE